MFYVVQLDSDIFKEKIVVPSIWLDKYDTLCLLPPVTDVAEVETLAKVQCTPKHGWQLHSVSFKQSFDTYSQAKENITKGKPVMIKLEEEEEEEQHDKEVRGKRKRKLPLFLNEYSVESDDDKEEGHGSTQDGCSIDYSIIPDPLIVKIEAIEDSNAPGNHQQSQLNTTHNKSSSSVHSSLQHDNQLQVAGSSSPTIRKKVTHTEKNTEIKDLLVSIWNKMSANESTEYTKCGNLEDILKSKNQEIERLQNELQNREHVLQERKEKYKEMKKKYKEKKKGTKEPQEGKKFGCGNLEDILKSKNQEIERLQKELQNREHSLQESKEKYKEMKKKYKEKKKETKESQEGKKFGSLEIAAEKLSLCRDKDYSKYVGDLLDICFGREILSKSVLKCPNKRTIKTNVLEQDVINDIACHTIEKFSSVSIAMVRAAIRQKLNTCHKAKKIK